MKPQKLLWHETPEQIERLCEYNRQDIRAEKEVSKSLPDMDSEQLKDFHAVIRTNQRGFLIDKKLCKTAVRFCSEFETEKKKRLFEITKGKVNSVKQISEMKYFLKSLGCVIPNLQALTVENFLKNQKDINPTAKEVLQIRQDISQSAIGKYKAMLLNANKDGRCRGSMMYHGATTGRLSGKYVQPHNFPRPIIKNVSSIIECMDLDSYELFRFCYGDEMFDALGTATRSMIKADKNKVLFGGDFSAIEARVLLWLVGETKLLAEFNQVPGPYEKMAALIYNISVNSINENQRYLGKKVVLACGYGMGHKKFFETVKAEGFNIDEKLSLKAVTAYREKYSSVKNFWYFLDGCIKKAIENKTKIKINRYLTAESNGKELKIILPSGRCLYYQSPGLEVRNSDYGPSKQIAFMSQVKGKWRREFTYGGKLTENICSGIARDLMVYAWHNLESADMPVILSVHDELVSEVDKEKKLEKFTEIMETLPAWAEGMILKVGKWSGDRYRK